MRSITYSQALNEALREEMQKDPEVIVLGEDVGFRGGAFGVTMGLWTEFGPDRVVDTPIAEASFTGMGVGLAMAGMRPVVEIMYIDFATLAVDAIVNQAAKARYMFGGKARIALTIRTQQGAGRGQAAQHSQSLEAWYCHVPGLKVVMPANPRDAKGLLKTAIRDDGPVMFIEHKLLYGVKGEVPEGDYTVPFGRAEVVRPGSDVTILAFSRALHLALEAGRELGKAGISAEIIDPRTLVPFDYDTLYESIGKTGRLIIVHEACKSFGVGGELAARVVEDCFDLLDAPVIRVAGKDTPIPYNPGLEKLAVPQVADIIDAVHRVLG